MGCGWLRTGSPSTPRNSVTVRIVACALAVALGPSASAQPPIRHVTESLQDRFLVCASQILGQPVVPDAFAPRLPLIPCPQSKNDLLTALRVRGLRLFPGTSAAFLTSESQFKGPSFLPPYEWTGVDIAFDVEVWGDFPDSRAPNDSERSDIVTEVLRYARPVPQTAPTWGDAAGVCHLKARLIIDIHRFSSSSPDASFVAVLGVKSGNTRLIYGERLDSHYRALWDSPVFSALHLEPAYADLDGDGADEILLWSGIADRYWSSQFVAFTRQGVELTRQDECSIDPLDGYDATGGACPISGQRIVIAPASKGPRELLVTSLDNDDRSNPDRYVLVDGHYRKHEGR